MQLSVSSYLPDYLIDCKYTKIGNSKIDMELKKLKKRGLDDNVLFIQPPTPMTEIITEC